MNLIFGLSTYTVLTKKQNTLQKNLNWNLDLIDILEQIPALVTIKDHKENFINNIQCRLINPSKSEIELISKQIISLKQPRYSNGKTQQIRSTGSDLSIRRTAYFCLLMLSNFNRLLKANFWMRLSNLYQRIHKSVIEIKK